MPRTRGRRWTSWAWTALPVVEQLSEVDRADRARLRRGVVRLRRAPWRRAALALNRRPRSLADDAVDLRLGDPEAATGGRRDRPDRARGEEPLERSRAIAAEPLRRL